MTYNEVYPDKYFLNALKNMPPLTTQQVADAVRCSKKTASLRLQAYEDLGLVRREKVPSRGREGFTWKWTLTEDAYKSLSIFQ